MRISIQIKLQTINEKISPNYYITHLYFLNPPLGGQGGRITLGGLGGKTGIGWHEGKTTLGEQGDKTAQGRGGVNQPRGSVAEQIQEAGRRIIYSSSPILSKTMSGSSLSLSGPVP